jgi:hypothetical protein
MEEEAQDCGLLCYPAFLLDEFPAKGEDGIEAEDRNPLAVFDLVGPDDLPKGFSGVLTPERFHLLATRGPPAAIPSNHKEVDAKQRDTRR